MTSAEKAFFMILPPRADATPHEVQQVSVTTSSAATSLTTGLTTADSPRGKVMITFHAMTSDVYLFLGGSGDTVTSTTGWRIPQDQERSYWVDLSQTTHVVHIGTASATLKWYISSPPNEFETRAIA